MRRNITLFSVAITAFSAVLLASAVYGYRVSAKPPSAPAAAALLTAPAARIPQPSPELLSAAPKLVSSVTPKAAAAAAVEFLGRSDLYSVEMTTYEGIPAYKVTFVSGDVVFLSLDAKLLMIVPAQVQMARVNQKVRERNEYDSGGKGEEHEEEEHEEEHEGGEGE